MNRIARFLALPPRDRSMFLQAWTARPLVRLALAALGFNRSRRLLAALSQPVSRTSFDASEAVHLARMARAAARHGAGPRHCLTEALTLWWLLRRHGIDSEIRIGVRKDNGGVDAHAWVEQRGLPLAEEPDVAETFAPLVRPAAG